MDHLNARTLVSVFEALKKGEDDAMVEKVAFCIFTTAGGGGGGGTAFWVQQGGAREAGRLGG